MPSPVTTEQFQRLWQSKTANRLPHALLFSGMAGSANLAVAEYMARALLCLQPSSQGECCQVCHACRLVEGKTHPNMLWIHPEKEGQAIKVDQIREVTDFVNQTSLQGGYRIIFINPADDMNASAANALLKSLEEPAPGAIFILVSQLRGRLPATILSRCQRVLFAEPTCDEIINMLPPESQTIRQQLYTALMQTEGTLKAASELHQHSQPLMLDFLISWMMDLLTLQVGGSTTQLNNPDYQTSLLQLKDKTSVQCNVSLMNYLQKMRTQVIAGFNFNKQLLIEDILLRWKACYQCS